MPDLFEIVLSQRACRAFDPDAAVADGDLERVLQAATHAPSAENTQPWVFVVVRAAATRDALAAVTDRAWRSFVRDHTARTLPPRLFEDVRAGMEGGLRAAPVVVVVGADTERADPALAPGSIYPAVQNLLLAAAALGLGSCLTTLTTFFAHELRPLLALPETVVPMATIYLGHPARPLGPPRRRPVAEVAHRERYGAGW